MTIHPSESHPTLRRARPGPTRVRPVLLLLVYGVLLVVVGATASGQAALVSSNSQASTLNAVVNADAALVRSFVSMAGLSAADLDPDGRTPERAARLESGLRVVIGTGQILRAAIALPDGRVLASSGPPGEDLVLPMSDGLAASVGDRRIDAAIVPEAESAAGTTLATAAVLREYLPVIVDGRVVAVIAIWRDAASILAGLDQSRIEVVAITLSAAMICTILLSLIFRAAQRRLSRQSIQLLESARRDALTGSLNHGSIVEDLTREVDRARTDGGAIGIALIDLDNFGLLNDTYGHAAGDHALLEVARLIPTLLPPGARFGRYGPDEFLVIASEGEVPGLEPAVEQLRAALVDLSLQFGGSERLPVTVSAGLCFHPTNGESVTTLLAVVASTLDEAKASGGDALCVADASRAAAPGAQTFDVLQGLVIAVDTKDRYTRRHSEDVARYADFIAEGIGLDRETSAALHTAGLLHDVGKIGIPDAILRRPGRLSETEQAIVRQHVALGEMIVRDLPNIDLVRAGIRHHHERWDGKGYLAGLAGGEIPLVARILAVGDAFSAMTTTRPYRKALSIEEALRRLEDAAGSQLDEELVRVFVGGLQSHPNPPLPAEPKVRPTRILQRRAA